MNLYSLATVRIPLAQYIIAVPMTGTDPPTGIQAAMIGAMSIILRK